MTLANVRVRASPALGGVAALALVSGILWSPAHAQDTARTALAERQVQVPGARLGYIDSGGAGVPVIFLHAATGSSRVWEHQISAFQAAGYRFIAYDRRGYRRTEVDPQGPAASAVEDLDAFQRVLGLDRFHLVGTAAGGGTALGYALAHPDRLRSVVVANSLGGVQDPAYLEIGRRLRPPDFESLPADLRELGPSYRAANPEGTHRWLELERTSRAASERPRQPPPAASGAAAPPPSSNAVTFERLAARRTPVLLISGDADLYMPPSLLRMFAARIQGSESVLIDEAGHSAYWEQPEAFNTAVLSFLKRH